MSLSRVTATLATSIYSVVIKILIKETLRISCSFYHVTMNFETSNGIETEHSKAFFIDGKKGKTDLSDLALIEFESNNPFVLFRDWHREAKMNSNGNPNALCLATVSKDLKVSARHVILRDYDETGFVIVTDGRSRKSRELEEVPSAAMCILWAHPNEKGQNISRQVRMEGKIEKLASNEFQHLYDREPLYCKIRSHLCWQDQRVDWDEHKRNHDKLMREIQEGKQLPMPDHFVAYRLCPDTMEFYFAYDHLIADRLLFEKKLEEWTITRLAA